MANGYATGVIFDCQGITQTIISGSVIAFKLARQGEIKEIADASNNYIGVYAGKLKKVGNLTVLLTTSGSTVTLPTLLATATFSNPYSADVSGNWGVTGQPSIAWKNDDFAVADVELTQWITSTGTLP